LEAATGTGLISLQLSNLVSEVTAIDLSPEMLKIAKEKAEKQSVKNIDFRIGDICNLDFSDNSFYSIIASNVLHLLFDPGQAMQEIKRVLKENGTIIIPTYCHGENLTSHFFSRCMNIMGFRARTRWSVASLKKFVEKSGFEIIKCKLLKGVIPMVYLVARPHTNSKIKKQ
ncbi:MAG: class I SAM-dependent methyltransferase, partial [Mangrovibacterium sp.]